ncbi:BTAD domain-containing putative transcriptional regulator [uncultured Jatrophihabitans sp.]|uniref:BTAD domain-containing putative transcriptional regulator n=1 Tax=uncultured Jatrophihabitans sp. TaxID=1610747 RepID=UPI0035CA9C19
MEYRILGPLEAVRDGRPIDLGSPKQRAVLASLVLEAGRVVPTERLVDQVWGDDPPGNVAASLQAYVSNLRRLLRDDAATAPIARQLPGYRLDVADGQLDVQRFRAEADAAQAAVDDRKWTDAVVHAEQALALWRGELLADMRDDDWVRVAAVSLAERHAVCTEDLVTALLGTNRTGQAVGVARVLHAAQPLRERACWLYLLALHRDGRTTEALDRYREHVARLDEELGLEPGPALRDLQGAMLRQDPDVACWPNASSGPAPGVVVPAGGGTAPDAATMPARGGFVGRTAELAEVSAALAEARGGVTRWLFFTGPAGIGKTRLAEEALGQAVARGMRVLRAGCPDDVGAPPWWPIAQLLRALTVDPEPVLARDPDAEADRARFATYERVRALFEQAAAERPVAVFVDDVQWADPSSLGMLAHLAFALDGTPVLFVLTARTGVTSSDLRRLLDAIARRTGTRQITVPPLAGSEVGELVHAISGEHVRSAEASLLRTRTGGNPFFVGEYARLARTDREAGTIPLAVRSVLGRRLAALDAGALHVIRTAAVIGDTLDFGLLRTVTRLDADELADLLDEAADEHIVVVAPGSSTYSFAHGLLRDEVLAGMTDVRRQRLHARVAAALGEGTATEDLARRATHLVAALPLVEVDDAFAACRAVADDADAHWQTDSAAYWWQAALRTYDQLPAGGRDPDVRDDLVRRQLAALIRAGRGQTVYEVIDTEMQRALADGRFAPIAMMCANLIRSTGAWPWAAFGQDPGPLLATMQRAEQQTRDDPHVHPRVLAALAIGSCYSPDETVPDRLSQAALDAAERLADPDVLADALLGRALTFSGVAIRARESCRLLERLAELPHTNARLDAVISHGVLTMARATLGDMAGAAEDCRLGSIGSDELRLPISRVQFRLFESMLALWVGRFDDAERLFADGLRLHEQTELYFGWSQMATVVLRWKQGTPHELLEPEPGYDPHVEEIFRAVRARDFELADRLIEQFLADEGPVIWTSHGSWALVAHMVADAGLVRHAAPLIDRLQPLAGLLAVVGQLTLVSPVSLCLARLHHLVGADDTARRELASALALCQAGGGHPSELRCRLLAVEIDGAPSAAIEALADEAEVAGLAGIAREARALAG